MAKCLSDGTDNPDVPARSGVPDSQQGIWEAVKVDVNEAVPKLKFWNSLKYQAAGCAGGASQTHPLEEDCYERNT
jgi:hypothetical protein